jgi:hypothetical protein
MAKSDLLKEAIADAKAVKETAIANAKAALEEAFTPYLKEKLAAKLAEMDEMDEAKEEVAEEQKYGGNKGDVPAAKRGDKKDTAEEEGVEDYKKRVKEADDAEGYEGQMGKKDLGVKEAEDMDEEMDLDELLAELDDEMSEGEDVMEAEEEEVEAEESEEVEGEDEEIDLEEMSEEDLKSFIEDVIADMVKAGELEAGEEFEAEGEEAEGEEEIEVEDEAEEIMEGEEEVNEIDLNGDFPALAEMLGVSIEAAKYLTIATGLALPVIIGMIHAGGEAVVNFFKKLATKKAVAEETEEMDEMKKEIEELKSELNEINLLNSKLLYVNKIFRSKNLSENQKAKVLGAFDKASTVAEVKLVFETLSEGLTTAKAAIKENLGSASKTIAAPTKKPILEVNNQFERWQKLAGIK